MKQFNWQSFLMGLSVTALLVSGYFLNKKDNDHYKSKEYKDSIKIPDPINKDYSNVRSWDYDNQRWNYYEPLVPVRQQSKNYSDEEIRILREKQSFQSDGSYIYTPGRHIPTREELSRKEIERYIDKHGEEVYEELHDKYGN